MIYLKTEVYFMIHGANSLGCVSPALLFLGADDRCLHRSGVVRSRHTGSSLEHQTANKTLINPHADF